MKRALNRCEACFNWVWMVQLTWTLLVHGQSRIYEAKLYMTRNPCMKHQGKEEKQLAYSPYSAMQICWWHYTADFWTHFHFDYSLVQWAAMLQIRLNYTASNVVNTQPRNSRVHACELHKKEIILPRLGQKTYSSLFLLAFFDLGRRNPYHWKLNGLAVSK